MGLGSRRRRLSPAPLRAQHRQPLPHALHQRPVLRVRPRPRLQHVPVVRPRLLALAQELLRAGRPVPRTDSRTRSPGTPARRPRTVPAPGRGRPAPAARPSRPPAPGASARHPGLPPATPIVPGSPRRARCRKGTFPVPRTASKGGPAPVVASWGVPATASRFSPSNSESSRASAQRAVAVSSSTAAVIARHWMSRGSADGTGPVLLPSSTAPSSSTPSVEGVRDRAIVDVLAVDLLGYRQHLAVSGVVRSPIMLYNH